MDCKETNELFTAYLDGEVTPKEHEQMQQHLVVCPLCREELDALSLTRARLRQTLDVAAQSAERSVKAWSKIKQGIEVDSRIPVKGGQGSTKASFGSWLTNLFTRRPVWKPVALGALAIVIVVSLVVAIPPLFKQDDNALAAEIALSNPEVKAILGSDNPKVVEVQYMMDLNTGDEYAIVIFDDDTVEYVRVTESTGDIFTVEVWGINGTHLDVTVDLSTKTVMEVLVGPAQNFTDDEVEKVILILQSDDAIKALLEQGAIIQSMSNYSLKMKPAKLGEGTGEIIEKKVHVTIALGDKLYLADIELISGQLLGFGDYGTMKAIPSSQP